MERPPSGTIVHLDCTDCRNNDACTVPRGWHWAVDLRQPSSSSPTYVSCVDEGRRNPSFEYSCPTAQLRLAQKLVVVGNELRMEEV